MAFILILCHCIVVLFELCIDNIDFFFLPATRVSFDGIPVRETNWYGLSGTELKIMKDLGFFGTFTG